MKTDNAIHLDEARLEYLQTHEFDGEDITRLIGYRDGLATAILAIKKELADVRRLYERVPSWQVRKLDERDARAAPLKRLIEAHAAKIAELKVIFDAHNNRELAKAASPDKEDASK